MGFDVHDNFIQNKTTLGELLANPENFVAPDEKRITDSVRVFKSKDGAITGLPSWLAQHLDGLEFNGRGGLDPSSMTIDTILNHDPQFKGIFAYNVRKCEMHYKYQPPFQRGTFERAVSFDTDLHRIVVWFAFKYGIRPTPERVQSAIISSAMLADYDPMKVYFEGLEWDRVERLDRWLVDCAQADDKPIIREFSRKYLISAVARTYCPGCQVDTMLILQGDQGLRKSSLLATLASPDYFTDHISDISSKDARQELQGPLIIELAELESMSRKSASAIKSFLTTRSDRFRLPFARSVQDFPRRCVFAGSTNDDTFLKDDTGGRRFWPVRVGKINIAAIEKYRDQLWAEAVFRFKAGEPWWITEAEMESMAGDIQEEVREKDAWEEEISNYILSPRRDAPMKWDPMFKDKEHRKWFSMAEAFEVLKIELKDQSRYTNKINSVCRSLGLKKKGGRVIVQGKRYSVYDVSMSFYATHGGGINTDQKPGYQSETTLDY